MVPDTACLVYGSNRKQAGTVDQKVFSGVLQHIFSDKSHTQKLEISTKIDVYRYSKSH
jgi:hypothetical protein